MADPFESFSLLKMQGLLTPEGNTHFRVERAFLISLMAKRLADMKFDEAWYLSKYPDVREAIKRGAIASGREHYIQFGYFENRMPIALLVNEKWYLDTYPDVAKAIKAGVYKSGQAHFDQAGFGEGRMPYANFYP
jgi:hypothetical protein